MKMRMLGACLLASATCFAGLGDYCDKTLDLNGYSKTIKNEFTVKGYNVAEQSGQEGHVVVKLYDYLVGRFYSRSKFRTVRRVIVTFDDNGKLGYRRGGSYETGVGFNVSSLKDNDKAETRDDYEAYMNLIASLPEC